MKAKKWVALMLTAVLGSSLLSGCGNAAKPAGTEGTASSETTAGAETGTTEAAADKEDAAGGKTVIKMTKWGDPGAEEVLVKEFNESNDKIEIRLDAIPGDGYGDRLTTSFSSGDGYDIFLSGEGDFYKWVGLGMTTPLDELIAADQEWQNPMDSDVMNMGMIDGSQSYLIKDYNPMCLWYNKDLFDAAGVDYPTDSWTWDDLYEAAKKLTVKKADGTVESFGFQAQSWDYAVACYLESLGYSYISEDYKTADGYLNNKDMVAALDTYFSWAEGEDRISPNTADTDTYGDGTAMMINGKLAMMISGGWAKTGLEDAGTNYATALIPGNHKSYFCASGYAISSSSKNKEAAWEVLKWLTGERASEVRAEKEAVFPTAAAQLESVKAGMSEDQKALISTLEYSVPPIGMRGELGSKINVALSVAFERIIYKDGATQDIMNEALASLDQQ